MMDTRPKLTATREPHLRDLSQLSGDCPIFGLSGDPIHRGHVNLVLKALEKIGGRDGLFMLAKQNPHKKDAPKASDADRLEMLKLAIKSYPNLWVSDIELQRPGVSYTIDTVREIKQLAPKVSPWILMGADQLPKLHLWKEYKELFVVARPLVVGRLGFTIEMIDEITTLTALERKALKDGFIEFDDPISSTQIRAAIKAGDYTSIAEALDPSELEYIRSRGLYLA